MTAQLTATELFIKRMKKTDDSLSMEVGEWSDPGDYPNGLAAGPLPNKYYGEMEGVVVFRTVIPEEAIAREYEDITGEPPPSTDLAIIDVFVVETKEKDENRYITEDNIVDEIFAQSEDVFHQHEGLECPEEWKALVVQTDIKYRLGCVVITGEYWLERK